jgi:hypothetical protein
MIANAIRESIGKDMTRICGIQCTITLMAEVNLWDKMMKSNGMKQEEKKTAILLVLVEV